MSSVHLEKWILLFNKHTHRINSTQSYTTMFPPDHLTGTLKFFYLKNDGFTFNNSSSCFSDNDVPKADTAPPSRT